MKKMSKKQIFSIGVLVLTLLVHFAIGTLLLFISRYSSLHRNIFLALFLIVLAIVIIFDLVFWVAYKYKDIKLKTVNAFLAIIILIITMVANLYLWRINKVFDKVLSNGGVKQYEKVRVTLASNNKNFTDLKSLSGKTLGVVKSNEQNSVAALTKSELEKNNINVNIREYNNTNAVLTALFNKDIDAFALQSSFRSLYQDEKAYAKKLAEVKDIYTFEKEVLMGENKSANTDLSAKPFNILLIGYAPEPGGTTGLADSIIVASVNPKSMQVSLSSIARDSYVPISCWGGAYSKINDARASSRACLMQTVSNLLDTPIDFYMEVNFKGVVDIVNALGGIWIDSPVEFVGQDSDSTRGNRTVWVGKGGQFVDGEQALAFARERHAMPNGDFDRQKHQKEVIAQIVERLLALKDTKKALAVMDAAGENLATNLSLNQLTTIFNYIINIPNNTGLSTFQTIDIQNLRITGYSSWHFHEGAHLALWIYKPYKGSVAETKERMQDVLGLNEIKQQTYFKFFVEYPYTRQPLFHTSFNEVQEHEKLPPLYVDLTKMTLEQALAWAQENGATLSIKYIEEGDSNYDPNSVGKVISQSVAEGELIRDYPTCEIVVMGKELDESEKVPNFVGQKLEYLEEWCLNNNYTYEINDTGEGEYGVITSQNIKAGSNKNKYKEIVISCHDYPSYDLEDKVIGKSGEEAYQILKDLGYSNIAISEESEGWQERKVISVSPSTAKTNRRITLTVEEVTKPTPSPSSDPSPSPNIPTSDPSSTSDPR